ncbi:MAG TPA: hypothetical protein VLC93_02595, partial [Myxococcota bacterium]|nr:hypothetical protein [Myxococcota bacterium]
MTNRSICVTGSCQPQPCSGAYPDGRCFHPDDVCNSGTCVRLPCSSEHLEGGCYAAGEACVAGECGVPTCSEEQITGTCGGVDVCIADISDPAYGSCQTPCDGDHFDGHCPPGDECVLGACTFACESSIRCGAAQTCCDVGYFCSGGECAEQCSGGEVACGQSCCTGGEVCAFDTCIRDQGPCIEDGECEDDSYCNCPGGAPCNPAGSCLPYGLDPDHPPFNEDCANEIVVGVFAPGHQCIWTGPTDRVAHCGTCENPAGDAKTCQDGLCVGCGADSDCSTREICEGGTCHTSCAASPAACAATETCRVAPGTRPACYECVDTATDTDCYGGLTCVRGYCVDPYAAHTRVLSTPTVVDFDFDGNPNTLNPSIVFVATDHDGGGSVDCQDSGIIRVIDGRDCRTQFVVNRRRDDLYTPADLAPAARVGSFPDVRACNPVALADLDRTAPTRSEIVAHASTSGSLSPDYGGLVAFRYAPAARAGRGAFELAWHSTNGAGSAWDNACSDAPVLWSGPSVFDLDGDGP